MKYINGTPIERFTPKYDVVPSGCWQWNAAFWNSDGYGCFGVKIDGVWKIVGAHRFSYEHFVGKIPEEMCVCHKCDNPACVNPEHLFLGTHTDNMRDRKAKGRNPDISGVKNPNAKLTEEDVKEVLRLRKAGLSSKQIAEKMSQTGISIQGIRSMLYRHYA